MNSILRGADLLNVIDRSVSAAKTTAAADDRPRFAVWPYLNPYIRNHEDVPAAKCYDGSEAWDSLPGIVSDDERQRRLAERGRPFLTNEQIIEWRQGVVMPAEPERVALRIVATKEQLCRTHNISSEEFAQRFTLVEEPNIYQSGWRPGRTNAIARKDYRPYYGPVCNLSEADGPICNRSLRRFWKYNDIETPTLEPRHLIDEEFKNMAQGVDNDPRCSLGEDWRFDDIERRAYGKQGHQFEGLRFRSYQQRIAAAAYDLDEALHEVHPNAPASARASFWQSYEVHRHLCMFVRWLIEYTDTLSAKARTPLDHPSDAFLCAQKRIMTFARVLMDDSLRIKRNHILKKESFLSKLKNAFLRAFEYLSGNPRDHVIALEAPGFTPALEPGVTPAKNATLPDALELPTAENLVPSAPDGVGEREERGASEAGPTPNAQGLGDEAQVSQLGEQLTAYGSKLDSAEWSGLSSLGVPDKGNLDILRKGGALKEFVTLETACRFGGVTRRAIEKAVVKGSLETVGKRQNRRISVESLLKYFPPENKAN